MPEEVKNLCRLADIHSKSLLLQVVRQGDPQKMVALVEKISRDEGATREAVRRETAKPKAGPAEGVHLQLQGPDQGVQAAAAVHEVHGRARRSHRRARGHHQGAAGGEVVGRVRFATRAPIRPQRLGQAGSRADRRSESGIQRSESGRVQGSRDPASPGLGFVAQASASGFGPGSRPGARDSPARSRPASGRRPEARVRSPGSEARDSR